MKKFKEKVTLSNIIHYLVGNFRHKAYYSKYKRHLLRPHIIHQIDYRLKWMDKECWDNGECKMCGCSTTELQMANKQCKKPCYPPMFDKDTWSDYVDGASIVTNISKDKTITRWKRLRSSGQPSMVIYKDGDPKPTVHIYPQQSK